MSEAFDRLRGLPALAWDFDDTLVGHGASPAMHRFIAETPHITHSIVTFRALGSERQIWEDLALETDLLAATHFRHVINIDDGLATLVQRLRRHRHSRLFAGPEGPAERAYRHWKGMVCARIGAIALIDDRTEDVAPGCDAFGIMHLHPDQLL